MTKTPELEARVALLEARVETLGRRLTQVIGDTPGGLDEHASKLYEALKAWRHDKARELACPPYVVFPDKALAAIASVRPVDRFEMARIKGIADKRVEEYGDDVLAIVASHAW